VDWLFLLVLGVVLFLARDVVLLSALPRDAALKTIAAYAAVFLAVFLALGTIADFVSRDEALRLLRDARLWIPAVLLHALLWIAFASARNKRNARSRVFWLVLVPAPVFLYCAGGLCWLALTRGGTFDAATTGGLLGCLWVAVIAACSWRVRQHGTAESRTGASLDLAAAANLSAILLLPLHSYSQQSALAETAFQWRASALPLAATAGLIGASFLFHRLRRSP
jgi:hypothetical protein